MCHIHTHITNQYHTISTTKGHSDISFNTGNLDMVDNVKLKKLILKGPKYRLSKSIKRGLNFKLLIDSVEDFARKCTNISHMILRIT